MKKWIAILLVAMMALALVACGSKGGAKGNTIVGTWVLTGGEGDEADQTVQLMLAYGMTMTFTFNEDGTGSETMSYGEEGDTQNFTYTLENGQIVIEGSGADYKLDGDKLTIQIEGMGLVFTRK
ncbi:MAG: lipocalin family protein [Clostridia bacterium]|nr:lipocalin family protein [Clostridia bacterium]